MTSHYAFLAHCISQMAAMTSADQLTWSFLENDEFILLHPLSLKIGWRWWYGQDSITFDRQVCTLAFCDNVFPIAIGSELFEHCIYLLSSISDDFRLHFERIAPDEPAALVDKNQKEPAMKNTDIHMAWISIVNHAIQEARNGVAHWQKVDDSHWMTIDGAYPLEIELLSPVDDTDSPISFAVARIGIYHKSFVTLACSGTRLMYAVRELLASVDEHWHHQISVELNCLKLLQLKLDGQR